MTFHQLCVICSVLKEYYNTYSVRLELGGVKIATAEPLTLCVKTRHLGMMTTFSFHSQSVPREVEAKHCICLFVKITDGFLKSSSLKFQSSSQSFSFRPIKCKVTSNYFMKDFNLSLQRLEVEKCSEDVHWNCWAHYLNVELVKGLN